MIMSSLQCVHAQQQRGKATFYSRRATGARTSSGQRLHHDSLTCAHRTYPFGTKLLVKNLSNGKQVVVTVNDRGPFSRGRIVDLTYAAAKRIGMVNDGVATVEVSVYNESKGIPYMLEPESLPEIDFEQHAPDTVETEEYRPAWQKQHKSTKKKSTRKKRRSSKKKR